MQISAGLLGRFLIVALISSISFVPFLNAGSIVTESRYVYEESDEEQNDDVDDTYEEAEFSDGFQSTLSFPWIEQIRNFPVVRFFFGTGRRVISAGMAFVIAYLAARFWRQRRGGLAHAETQTVGPGDLLREQHMQRRLMIDGSMLRAQQMQIALTALFSSYGESGQVPCVTDDDMEVHLPEQFLQRSDALRTCLEDMNDGSLRRIPLPGINSEMLYNMLLYLNDEIRLGDEEELAVCERVVRHAQRELAPSDLIEVLALAQQYGLPESIIAGIAQRLAQHVATGLLPLADLMSYPEELREEIAKYYHIIVPERSISDVCDEEHFRLAAREVGYVADRHVVDVPDDARLDLRGVGITSIAGIDEMCEDPSGIEVVDCAGCKVRTISKVHEQTDEGVVWAPAEMAFAKLANLRVLNLAGNKIRVFHAKLPPTLVKLSLECNEICDISDESLRGLINLEVLLLNNNALIVLPAAVTAYRDQLPRLERLDISHNPLEGEPLDVFARVSSLGRANGLNVFLCDGCWVGAIPTGELYGLKKYSHAGAELTSMDHLGQGQDERPSDLEELDLSANSIQALAPQLFAAMSALRYLNLSDNGLTVFPYEVAQCARLEELYLAGNRIGQQTDHEPARLNIKVLSLADNGLEALPEHVVGSCTRLEVLHLNDNNLSELPEVLGILICLFRLYLDGNRSMKALPRSLQEISFLHYVGLQGSSVRDEEKEELRAFDTHNLKNITFSLEDSCERIFASHSILYQSRSVTRIALNELETTGDGFFSKITEYLRGKSGAEAFLRGRFRRIFDFYNADIIDLNVSCDVASIDRGANRIDISMHLKCTLALADARGKKRLIKIDKSEVVPVPLSLVVYELKHLNVLNGLLSGVIRRGFFKDIGLIIRSTPSYEGRLNT